MVYSAARSEKLRDCMRTTSCLSLTTYPYTLQYALIRPYFYLSIFLKRGQFLYEHDRTVGMMCYCSLLKRIYRVPQTSGRQYHVMLDITFLFFHFCLFRF